MKLGTYKEDDWNVTYYENGEVWSTLPHPFMTEKQYAKWKALPDGYRFPDPEYQDPLSNHRIEIIDFGSTPPRVLTTEEIKELYNE